MMGDRKSQERFAQSCADLVDNAGAVLVETHNPEFVELNLNRHSGFMPYPGTRTGLVSFSEVVGEQWTLDYYWLDNGEATHLSETSLLTTADQLDSVMATAGFVLKNRWASITDRQPFDPITSPMYASIYRSIRT